MRPQIADAQHHAFDGVVEALKSQFDPAWGGFSVAPKFPPSGSLDLLLRHYYRTGEEATLKRLEQRTNEIVLHPANSALSAMHFSPERIQIQGVLVGQMRRYH